jgi:hypothetical protein
VSDDNKTKPIPDAGTPGTGPVPLAIQVRRKLYLDLQMVVAGHVLADALAAQIDSLAATLTFASDDKTHARELIKVIAEDIEDAVIDNWETVAAFKRSVAGDVGNS